MTNSDEIESNVRSYSRIWPTVFSRSLGSWIFDHKGKGYLDFFCGAGALNFGHNHPLIKNALVEYLLRDGILHSLDCHTEIREQFIQTYKDKILKPRGLRYKIQFTGPTGTNAVEAALRLARKVTKRRGVFALMGSYHGMTEASLSVTSDVRYRGSEIPLNKETTFFPFPGELFDTDNVLGLIELTLSNPHSGVERPAAFIVEYIQCEGGIREVGTEFLKKLKIILRKYEIILIIDEIQSGIFRAGNYFSHEKAGVEADMVVLSKSLSGIGLPFSILLLNEDLDLWRPGEYSGTFRGNQLAFVASNVLHTSIIDSDFLSALKSKTEFFEKELTQLKNSHNAIRELRVNGLLAGLDLGRNDYLAKKIQAICFEKALIIERCGENDSVIKLLPPLTASFEDLSYGVSLIDRAFKLSA